MDRSQRGILKSLADAAEGLVIPPLHPLPFTPDLTKGSGAESIHVLLSSLALILLSLLVLW